MAETSSNPGAARSMGPRDFHQIRAVGFDLDHTLAVCRYWNALPSDTTIIEVEPADSEFGWGFSEPVEAAVTVVLERVRTELGI